MIRNPAVAGQFYPDKREDLSIEIERLAGSIPSKKEDAIGIMLPHAGYMYSGAVAASVLASVNPRQTYIIMGPNHTGLGQPFSVSASDSWKTPLGDVKICAKLIDRMLKDCDILHKDEFAHIHEHSIEVQLPFLQKFFGEFTFVPVVIAAASLEAYRSIGSSMARSIKGLGMEKSVSIIASSDMTHYESQKSAKDKDSKALDAIIRLDEAALIERVQELDITMCGFAPAAIMISAVKELGAKKARVVKYQTSGDVTGDTSSVVGYAGVIIN
jgi:AmmeMemoRadiSam system protein B